MPTMTPDMFTMVPEENEQSSVHSKALRNVDAEATRRPVTRTDRCNDGFGGLPFVVQFHITDQVGQTLTECTPQVYHQAVRAADVILIVTTLETWSRDVKFHLTRIHKAYETRQTMPYIIIVINKIEGHLRSSASKELENDAKVKFDEIVSYSKQHGCECTGVSALTGHGVARLRKMMTRKVFESYLAEDNRRKYSCTLL